MLRRAYCLIAALVLVSAAACSEPPPPISVEDGFVTVLNQSDKDWKNVLVTVNDHFRGFAPVLKAEGRFNAPLSQFTTGHGQRWDTRDVARKVEVKAENPDGSPVALSWEIGQQRKKR